jgi:hypothetical protein
MAVVEKWVVAFGEADPRNSTDCGGGVRATDEERPNAAEPAQSAERKTPERAQSAVGASGEETHSNAEAGGQADWRSEDRGWGKDSGRECVTSGGEEGEKRPESAAEKERGRTVEQKLGERATAEDFRSECDGRIGEENGGRAEGEKVGDLAKRPVGRKNVVRFPATHAGVTSALIVGKLNAISQELSLFGLE